MGCWERILLGLHTLSDAGDRRRFYDEDVMKKMYLEHTIDATGIHPVSENVDAILRASIPSNFAYVHFFSEFFTVPCDAHDQHMFCWKHIRDDVQFHRRSNASVCKNAILSRIQNRHPWHSSSRSATLSFPVCATSHFEGTR